MMLMFNVSFATKPATASQSEERSANRALLRQKILQVLHLNIADSPHVTFEYRNSWYWSPEPSARMWLPHGPLLAIAFCSDRNPSKAREIIEAIRSSAGNRGKGGEQTKALTDGHRIEL